MVSYWSRMASEADLQELELYTRMTLLEVMSEKHVVLLVPPNPSSNLSSTIR
jgi:hypothetical protein